MLAIVWAMKKCSIYLQGMQKFEVATDHRPLVPILNGKGLQDIANPRLQRLKECLAPYNFAAVWHQGRLHAIPDALSRYPVEQPTEDDKKAERQVSSQISSMVIRMVTNVEEDGTRTSPFEDVTLTAVRAASQRDPEILALKEATLAGFPDHKSDVEPHLRTYWSVRDRLTVDGDLVICGQRLVLPRPARSASSTCRSSRRSRSSSCRLQPESSKSSRQTSSSTPVAPTWCTPTDCQAGHGSVTWAGRRLLIS